MNKIKNLFKMIKDYFYSIFNKPKIKLIEKTTTTENNNMESKINSYQTIDDEKNEFNNSLNNKEEFWVVYENVKNGVIKPEELMIDDLIKVQFMMKNELDYMDEKINISEEEINSINEEINIFKDDNQRCYAKLKNHKKR